MAITPEDARRELARRELARRESMRSQPSSQQQPTSMAGKVWGAMGVPAKKSAEGFNKMADMYSMMQTPPTGNKVKDISMNALPIMGESGMRTMGKVASGFVSPESMVTAAVAPALGAVGKGARAVMKPVGRWMGSQMEDLSGMVPGSLRESYNRGFQAFKGSTKDATALYEQGKKTGATKAVPEVFFDSKGLFQKTPEKVKKLPEVMKGSLSHKALVKAADELAERGTLGPADALKARKSIDQMIRKKSAPLDVLFEKRSKMNEIVKSNPNFVKADEAYQKGAMAESLKSVFPKTAQGKPSSWKTMMAGLSGVGPLWSPVALGTASALAGKIGKIMSGVIDQPIRSGLTAVGTLNALKERKGE